jgi:hypothetical protein
MQNIIDWMKENLGNNIQIITPQFERTEKLDFEFVPENDKQFYGIVNNAPWDILKGMGFRKWDTMNNIIAENIKAKGSVSINIPIVNSESMSEEMKVDYSDGCMKVDLDKCSSISAPDKLFEIDEDILLFPGEWFNIIPEGFLVTDLFGEQYAFIKEKSDDDIRFGCLAYGIRRKIIK